MAKKSKKTREKWKPDGSIHLEESYWDNKIEPMSILGRDSPGPMQYPDINSNFKNLSKYKSYGSVKIAEGNPKSDVDWKIYRYVNCNFPTTQIIQNFSLTYRIYTYL
jgi:hypothetical protein